MSNFETQFVVKDRSGLVIFVNHIMILVSFTVSA